jgi:hypothetical protein
MPVHEYTIRWGSTGRSILVQARTSAGPATGLHHDSPGAIVAYVREGEGATRVELVLGAVTEYRPGAWIEIDPDLAPGLYQLGLPDAVLARGTARAMVVFGFPGVSIDPVEIELVAYDPLDTVRLGLTSLGPAERIAALRGAFPLLAAKEIAEREAMQG